MTAVVCCVVHTDGPSTVHLCVQHNEPSAARRAALSATAKSCITSNDGQASLQLLYQAVMTIAAASGKTGPQGSQCRMDVVC